MIKNPIKHHTTLTRCCLKFQGTEDIVNPLAHQFWIFFIALVISKQNNSCHWYAAASNSVWKSRKKVSFYNICSTFVRKIFEFYCQEVKLESILALKFKCFKEGKKKFCEIIQIFSNLKKYNFWRENSNWDIFLIIFKPCIVSSLPVKSGILET